MSKVTSITWEGQKVQPCQLRAARAYLGLTQGEIAREAGISLGTLKRLETDETSHVFRSGSVDGLLAAYERRGILFTGPVFHIEASK